jgi:sigma-54 dependent transcriptional regulator, acetoin dehydrogenase operon transcriptional activator AcoR
MTKFIFSAHSNLHKLGIIQEDSMSDEPNSPVASRILIVEDEMIFAKDLSLTLEDLGYEVIGTAWTAELALQLTEESKPDLVLMDIKLAGGIDGIQASEQIRARFDIPVIFLTAHGEGDVIFRARVTEPYGFLAKPISRNALKTTIETALYKHAADKRVRESEERYRTLVEQSIDGIALVQGITVRFVNRALARMFGFQSPEEMVGQNFLTFVAPEYRDLMEKRGLELEVGKSVPDYYEFTALRKDGTPFDAELRVNLTTYKGEKIRQGLIRDITERKRAEEAIRQSEARTAKAEELAGLHSWEWDIGTGRLVRSEGSYRTLGLHSGVTELNIDSFINSVHADDRYLVQKALGDGADGVRPYDIEFRIVRPDGEERVLHSRGEVQRDRKGQAIRMLGMALDITDRKKAEEALRESEGRFREFAAAVPQIVYEHDTDGKLIFLNRSGLDLAGYGPEDLDRGIKLTDVVRPEDRARFLVNLKKALQGESISGTEYTIIAKDGTRVPVIAYSSSVMREGKVVGVRGVCVDVSKLKQAEEVLRRSRDDMERLVAKRTAELESSNKQLMEEIRERIRVQEALAESEGRFRGIFETSTDCVFIKDLSFRYTLVNSAMCSLLGLTEAEIVGKTDTEMFGVDAAERLRSVDNRIARGEVLEEFQILPVKGALITFLTVKAPLTDSSGEVVGICGISRNVTERSALAGDDIAPTVHVRSAAMSALLNIAHLAAATDSTILITGESGTGKDYLARYIHGISRRSSGPYYSINCASIPSQLAESELFGHEAGAFTGAMKKKRGLLELAEGGTLLLNEMAELPLNLQAKLLAFLDTRTFTRVGGEKSVDVNLRLMAATNGNLVEEISAGRFRKDLFYRLNVISIGVPPLRERLEDLPGLVEELIEKLAQRLGLARRIVVEPRVMNTLRQYTWPGNVRELRNVLERALIISRGGPVKLQHIRIAEPKQLEDTIPMSFSADRPLPDVIAEIERSLIQQALQRAVGNKKEAANLLGISRFALVRHMKKWGISSFSAE